MHVLLDNMTATMIGMAVILMVVAVNLRERAAMTDATAFYATIHHQEEFAQVLTRDLNSIAEVETITMRSADSTFAFRGFIGNSSTEHAIVYKYRHTRTRNGIRYHRVERYVDGQLDGGSGDLLTSWQIEARDGFGAPVSDPDAARQVFVRFEVASLTARDRANADGRLGPQRVETSYWEGAISPLLLQ